MKSNLKNQEFPLKPFWLLFVTTIVFFCAESRAYEKCLLNKGAPLQRFLIGSGQSVNITLEMSNMVPNQLSTYVFKIFLQEVLGYAKVEIISEENNYDATSVVDRLSTPPYDPVIGVPKTMINLGVLVPPDFDTISVAHDQHVIEHGSIAPPVRFGWFIPFINEAGDSLLDAQDVHWALFKNSKYVSKYDIQEPSDWHLITTNSFSDYKNKKHYCMDEVCKQGIFIPKQCEHQEDSDSPCAVLLAPYYNATKFVVDHIRELELYVKVVWLGPNLKQVVTQLKNNYVQRNSDKKFIILNWSPSEAIPHTEKFVLVNFKRCELLKSSKDGCKYDLQRLVKFSWGGLKKRAKLVHESLYKVRFSAEDYNLLLELYNGKSDTTSVADVACEWMRRKSSTWRNWIEVGLNRNVLFLSGIFPITGSGSYKGAGILQGALMAKDAINNNNSLLRDYNLLLLVSNSQCKADKLMKAFIENIRENYYDNLVGILGPACLDGADSFVGLLKTFRMLAISYSSEGASFSDGEEYSHLFRTTGSNNQYKQVYLQMFKKMGWKKVATLTEEGQKFNEILTHMEDLFQQEGINFTVNRLCSRDKDMFAITRYLEDLKRKRIRIVIADVYDEIARSVMCQAFKLGMTAKQGYVWFLPYGLNATWYNTTYFNTHAHEKVNCTAENMTEAINGHFSIRFEFFAPDDAIMQENRTVGEWRERYKRARMWGMGASDYAGFAYDAVWAYALALDKLIKANPEDIAMIHSQNTTNKLIKLLKQTDFNGVSGRIKFQNFSKISNMDVIQWLNNNTQIIGHFYPNISDHSVEILDGTLQLNTSAITWLTLDGKRPDESLEYN